MALLGWNPGDNREVMRAEELIESFDLSRLTKSNSLFDRAKLLAFNTEHLRMVPCRPADRPLQGLSEGGPLPDPGRGRPGPRPPPRDVHGG